MQTCAGHRLLHSLLVALLVLAPNRLVAPQPAPESTTAAGPNRRSSAPAVVITGLRIGGVARPVPSAGEQEIVGLELEARAGGIHIEFAAVGVATGVVPLYQYRLEGLEDAWSAPAEEHAVTYAYLAHGRYRFVVRALDAGGRAGASPASVSFLIRPPPWRTWWVVFPAVGLVVGALYALHRVRVRRLLELERVRTRIATDLHDDIGSSLSQISVLSEVVRRRMDRGEEPVAEPLDRIGEISRELVDSMADIVWSVNPRRDRFGDLVSRMRGFANELFSSRDVQIRFQAPAGAEDVKVRPTLRRQVFLIFKEAMHNMIRHSDCSQADIALKVEGGWIKMCMSDDGRGFDPLSAGGGHGLASMQQRARSLGGSLSLTTRPGGGTAITLKVPMRRGRARRKEASS